MNKLFYRLNLHSKLWQFGFNIDKKWLGLLLLAIAPGLITSLFCNDIIWLMASFLAVCGILPLNNSFSSGAFAILYVVTIYVLSYILKLFILMHNITLLLVILLCIAIVGGILDNGNEKFRSFVTWLIIGSVYGGVKLAHNVITPTQSVAILVLTVIGILLVIIFAKIKYFKIRMRYRGISDPRFIFNFKYVLPIVITTLVWYTSNVQEPQWLIWSSLSVVYGELDATYLKFQQRALGVILGVGIGIVISLLLPTSVIITYISFILMMLSLRMFKDYVPGYFLRCFAVVIYAGNDSITIALERLGNVIIGGTIGLICTYGLIKLQQYIHRS